MTAEGVRTSSTSKRFRVKHLFYSETLEELVSRGVIFKIVDSHSNYSVFDVAPADVDAEETLYRLQEEINEVVLEDLAKNETGIRLTKTKKPKKLDIALAEKNGFYHRCIITDFICDGEYVVVYWIDVGGTGNVPVSTLKMVNEAIMSYPRLAYTVILDEMFTSSNFILWSEYQNAMSKLRKEKFSVVLCGPNELGGNLYCSRKVKLSYKESVSRTIDLKEEIKQLEKWQWEQSSNLVGSDNEVCGKGGYGTHGLYTVSLDRPVLSFPLHAHVDQFSATISRIVPDEQCPGTANLHIVLLNHPLYINNFNVLHHQLERYASSIRKSKFFPALNEPLLFKLANKKKYRTGLKCLGLGKWVRAIRSCKEGVYLLDLDNSVCFTVIPEEDFEMRRLHDDFFKVPMLRIIVRPKIESGATLSVAEAEEVFKIGSRYHFKITKDREGKESPYEVRFGPAQKEEENLTERDFFAIDHHDDAGQQPKK